HKGVILGDSKVVGLDEWSSRHESALSALFLGVTPGETAGAEGRAKGLAAKAEQDVFPEKIDVEGALSGNATLAANMLDNGADPENVRTVLEAIKSASADDNVNAGIDALIGGLPISQAEHQRRKGEGEISEKQPLIDAMVKAGVPRPSATLIALGKGSVEISAPGQLGAKQLGDLRSSILEAENAQQAVELMIPALDEDTVGMWAAMRDSETAGIAVQIPVIKSIAGFLGFSEEKVMKARVARKAAKLNVGILARFITRKGGRLSNEDRQFALDALGLFEFSATAPQAREVLGRLIRLAEDVKDTARTQIQSGTVLPAPGTAGTIVVRQNEDGSFTAIDPDGTERQLERVQ
ncbi:hypothetical protein LCGC14_1387170, partial [marine sediment metagenome]